MSAIRARARRLKRQHGLDLVVVDYLQLVSSARTDGRVQEVSEITRGLKTLAKELDVPVLALSQLSRAVEQREDKRPRLSDLGDAAGKAEVNIAKNRHGPTGVAHLLFEGPTTRFSDAPRDAERIAA